MIIIVGLFILFLLEWLKKVLFETAEEKDGSYAWMLSVLFFIPYFVFLHIIDTPSVTDYEYDGGYVIRPHDVQAVRSFSNNLQELFFSATFFLFATAIVTCVIHNYYLTKQIHKQFDSDYLNLSSNISKLLLWCPFITAGFILLLIISPKIYNGEPVNIWLIIICVLSFYTISLFVIRRTQIQYGLDFNWATFGFKFVLSNLVSIGLVVLFVFIIVFSNADFSH